MTAGIKNQDTIRSPWVWRKAVYLIIGGLLGAASLLGWVTLDQVDSWMEIVDRAMPTIGSILLLFAGTKTNHGSDDLTTEQDVRDAAAHAAATAVESVNRGMLEEIRGRLDSLAPVLGSSVPVRGAGQYPTPTVEE